MIILYSVMMRVFFCVGEASRSNEQVIPYVPYPMSSTGLPLRTKLKALDDRKDLRYNAPMQDHANGLHVPILACTIHPTTGAVLPVGGSQVDPVTGLPVAIEVGAMMMDAVTKMAVPVLGVDIDAGSGKIWTLDSTF